MNCVIIDSGISYVHPLLAEQDTSTYTFGFERLSGGKLIGSGDIGLCAGEEDGLVLLDYKTDSVSSMEELWNRYETQLDYYSEALAKRKAITDMVIPLIGRGGYFLLFVVGCMMIQKNQIKTENEWKFI